MRALIAEAVNLIVSIIKTDAGSGRRIEEVVTVKGFADGDYCFSQLE
jgi:Flp pilus assembly CpaF family ATPase